MIFVKIILTQSQLITYNPSFIILISFFMRISKRETTKDVCYTYTVTQWHRPAESIVQEYAPL